MIVHARLSPIEEPAKLSQLQHSACQAPSRDGLCIRKLAAEPLSLRPRSVTVPVRTVAPGHEHDMWLDVKQSGAGNQWTVGNMLAAAVGSGGGDASGRVGTGRLNPEQ